MTAKEMLLQYAAEKNDRQIYTDEQFLGKAMTEGICIDRSGGEITVTNIRRESKTIILTETRKWDTVQGKAEETTEIFRVEL